MKINFDIFSFLDIFVRRNRLDEKPVMNNRGVVVSVKEEGLLLVISAPSGTGKTTICRALTDRHPEFILSISATTRAPRPGEKDGRDYYFISKDEFLQKLSQGYFVEHTEIYGNLYGTPANGIKEALRSGKTMVFDIDFAGGHSIKKAFPDHTVLLYLLPPSYEALRNRIISRGKDSPDEIRNRLASADKELQFLHSYDYFVFNETVPQAVSDIEKIIFAEKSRTSRIEKFQAFFPKGG